MIKPLYSFALVCTLLFSCISNDDKELPDVSKSGLPRLIPASRDSLRKLMVDDTLAYNKYFASKLGLGPIGANTQNFKVRIWLYQIPLEPEIYVVDICNSNSKIEFVIIKYMPLSDGGKAYIRILRERVIDIPKSRWDVFLDTLYGYQIPFLKSGDIHLKGFSFLTTMSTIQFEIVKDSTYHFYEYKEPGFYRCVDTNSNNVHQFLSFLNREFDDSIYKPYQGTTGCK